MGIAIALTVMAFWATHLVSLLESGPFDPTSLLTWLRVLIQGYLYTGLFITAHDAMHGTVSRNHPTVNKMIGTVACLLFAGMSFSKLKKNHGLHHGFPGTDKDPDFYKSDNFVLWFGSFMVRYTTLSQLVIMGLGFNLLKLRYDESAIWAFWVVPALLGSLQLFTFGTYLPHKRPHLADMKPHAARSMPLNHALAMISCYFFGYHHEHHDKPGVPWWMLYKEKERRAISKGVQA